MQDLYRKIKTNKEQYNDIVVEEDCFSGGEVKFGTFW